MAHSSSCSHGIALAAASVAACLVVLVSTPEAAAQPPPPDLLVILADTGTTCGEGLPRLTRHPDAARHADVLSRGFSGSLLRLYRYVQVFRQRADGIPVEPAYLLLSTTQGGFPRFGFCLDDAPKRDVGYVDLHRSQKISGAFGAMDQIFPHELLHVITRQLAGPPPEGGANQVHAIGVRTDRFQAFNEGFAEHAQVMAVDDPEAPSDTASLASDPTHRDRAWKNLAAYRRALLAHWSLAPRHRLGFVLWFSSTEQALRYHAVKENLFAREPDLPPSVVATADPWAAYLLEQTMPGRPDGVLKAPPRLASTEGVVAAAMARWVALPAAQEPAAEASHYEAFGADRDTLRPLEHAYLKIFAVLADVRPHDLLALARAYGRRYPAEAPALRSLFAELGVDMDRDAPELWLASQRFVTGTTLFDQYRGLPRAHTFDLNAASPVDLAVIPGLSPNQVQALRAGMPYASMEDLAARGRVPAAVIDEIRLMRTAFAELRATSAGAEETLSLMAVFTPSLWRAAAWIVAAALAGAALYRWRRRAPVWRAAVNGMGAAAFGLLCAWVVDAPWWFAPAVPLALFGLPAVMWQLGRRRWAESWRVASGWILAVLPVVAISQPF